MRGRRRGEPQPADLQTLNFKVPDPFKREYKAYAAERGMSMLALLREGYELSKRKHKVPK